MKPAPSIHFKPRPLNNFGYVEVQYSPEYLQPLIQEVADIQANFSVAEKWNENLAGQLKHEYKLTKAHSFLETMIAPLFTEYDRAFNNYIAKQCPDTNRPSLKLKNTWVNFQRKHEFNPPHDHEEVMSFVIWLKIPYSQESERNASPGMDANINVGGLFGFQYSDVLGNFTTCWLPAYKDFEYRMLLFPAKMKHLVAPFYSSEDFRISVSGNFFVK